MIESPAQATATLTIELDPSALAALRSIGALSGLQPWELARNVILAHIKACGGIGYTPSWERGEHGPQIIRSNQSGMGECIDDTNSMSIRLRGVRQCD